MVYKEEPSTLNINMDQWMNPDEGEKKGEQDHPCHGTGRGRSDGHCQRDVHHPPAGPQGREAYRVQAVRMQALLKGIYVHKDLIFFHVSLTNNSNVPFDVDFVRFKMKWIRR